MFSLFISFSKNKTICKYIFRDYVGNIEVNHHSSPLKSISCPHARSSVHKEINEKQHHLKCLPPPPEKIFFLKWALQIAKKMARDKKR